MHMKGSLVTEQAYMFTRLTSFKILEFLLKIQEDCDDIKSSHQLRSLRENPVTSCALYDLDWVGSVVPYVIQEIANTPTSKIFICIGGVSSYCNQNG